VVPSVLLAEMTVSATAPGFASMLVKSVKMRWSAPVELSTTAEPVKRPLLSAGLLVGGG